MLRLGRLKAPIFSQKISVINFMGRFFGSTNDHGLERELLRLSTAKFLTKPLDFDVLLAELRLHIGMQQTGGNRALRRRTQ